MSQMQAIDNTIQENLEATLDELATLCSQPSISAQAVGIEECAELVSEMLIKRGFDSRVMPSDGFPVVFAEREGRSDRTLLFYNHYDVQQISKFLMPQLHLINLCFDIFFYRIFL